MELLKPRYSASEFAERGQALYERNVRSHVTQDDGGKFVAIDIETGAHEVDRDDYTASERLLRSHPDAQIWLCRVGQQAAYRIGGYSRGANA